MLTATVAPLAAPPAAPLATKPAVPRDHRAHGAFRTLLSELNPLQYLPVVGTIYRAVTGDTIPEAARFAGSLVVSGLTGGPVGVALNVGTAALEHVLGFDPERLATRLLADIGIGHTAAHPSAAPLQAGPDDLETLAWSRPQLAAYGVSTTQAGDLRRGRESGADVLNGLELARLGRGRVALTA